jgi:MFS family permease
MEVLSYRNIWILTAVPIGFSGAVLTFAGLWGVPFLRQVHGLDPKTAAAITSTLLVAWALGGPTLGSWSERMGMRKPLYLIASGVALFGWSAILYLPLPLWALVLLLVPTGFASGNIIIGFAWAKESVPLRLVGTASGVCNMGPLLGGMLLQPAVGWILDQRWNGALANGVRIYDASAYRTAFTLMFATMIVAAFVLTLARIVTPSRCTIELCLLREWKGGAFSDAHVLRRRHPGVFAHGLPCMASRLRQRGAVLRETLPTPPFTSLRRTPHRPVRDTPWTFGAIGVRVM